MVLATGSHNEVTAQKLCHETHFSMYTKMMIPMTRSQNVTRERFMVPLDS